jgi:ABC-type branched-subunit amino acid transport system substrate-binding protein
MRAKIGFAGPLSGTVRAIGESAKAAVELVLGGRFLLAVQDDLCTPEGGREAASRLADDPDIVGVVGHYCSIAALAAIDIYAAANLPLVIWGAHHPDIIDRRLPGIFRVCGTFREEAACAAQTAKAQGHRSAVLIHDATAYGREQARFFGEAWQSAGGIVMQSHETQTANLAPLPEADFVWLAAAPQGWWKAFAASLATLPVAPLDSAQLLRAVRAAGFRGPIFCAGAAMIDAPTLADAGAASEGAICVSEAHVPADRLAGYAAANGPRPLSPYARYAADAASLMGALITEGATTRADLTQALAAQSRTGATGALEFRADGQRKYIPMLAFRAHAGHWQPL